MALINHKILIIRGLNLLSFHGLDFIRVFQEKSYAQAKYLSSYHETRNSFVYSENRRIPKKNCLLTPILQGGIAFFAIFSTMFRFFQKTARNGKESIVLPDLRQDSGFPRKSLILRTNLSPFHEMVRNRMFLGKSHDSSSELMSSRYVGNICYILRIVEYSMFQINVY